MWVKLPQASGGGQVGQELTVRSLASQGSLHRIAEVSQEMGDQQPTLGRGLSKGSATASQ